MIEQFFRFLRDNKDIITVFKDIITSFALLFGGIWSYTLFVRKRQVRPRAKIIHKVIHKSITKEKSLLHIAISVTNIGDVLIRLREGEIWIQQVKPVVIPFLLQGIKQGDYSAIKSKNSTEIDWSLIDEQEFSVKDIQIEPGEYEEIYCDFIINSNVKVVKVYSWLKNKKILIQWRFQEIGWRLSTLYELES
ncbi:MAG: hypothetical protein AAGE84_10525 [Cyanobacteria bacterium P01_G01_bin.39]